MGEAATEALLEDLGLYLCSAHAAPTEVAEAQPQTAERKSPVKHERRLLIPACWPDTLYN